jgi:hypothetical protein
MRTNGIRTPSQKLTKIFDQFDSRKFDQFDRRKFDQSGTDWAVLKYILYTIYYILFT